MRQFFHIFQAALSFRRHWHLWDMGDRAAYTDYTPAFPSQPLCLGSHCQIPSFSSSCCSHPVFVNFPMAFPQLSRHIHISSTCAQDSNSSFKSFNTMEIVGMLGYQKGKGQLTGEHVAWFLDAFTSASSPRHPDTHVL